MDDSALTRLSDLLLIHYFEKTRGVALEKLLEDHLLGRLTAFRETVIPFLDNARSLDGLRILEIGCGTGSSTAALAEQGAHVTAIDVSSPALDAAKTRCTEYNLDVEFVLANAAEVQARFSDRHFDMIIFFACLEHMTHDERMASMKATWEMLSKGDLLCVLDAPNRLWYFDGHTSFLPFFMWLPDDLAFEYSQFSPRVTLRELDRGSEDAMLAFLRDGRGVSYHEFELTMMQVEHLDVVSCLEIFIREQRLLRRIVWRLTGHGYEKLLKKANPLVPSSFCQPYLNLIIRK